MSWLAFTAAALIATVPPAAARDELGSFLLARGYSPIALTRLPVGHQVATVTLNGVQGLFVVDSGANATVLNQGSLAKFGIAATDRTGGGPAVGAGGAIGFQSFAVRSFAVSGKAVPLPVIRTVDLAAMVAAFRTTSAADVDGVIGQDVLTRFGGIIDVAHGRLYLRLP